MKAVDLLLRVRDQADFNQPHQPQADRLRRQPHLRQRAAQPDRATVGTAQRQAVGHRQRA